MIKSKLIEHLIDVLKDKIKMLTTDIQSLVDSRNNDTKSSAGDKYETGREMAQIELSKLEIQLQKTKFLLNELKKIDASKTNKNIDFGSLIYTDKENYFISIPLGKVNVDDNEYYAISLASPIGLALKGKTKGDKVQFGGRLILIQEII